MTDHELRSWLENAEQGTAIFYHYATQMELDDSFGWGERLSKMWNIGVLGPPPQGLLLTGPDGCGKHTAAAHMYQILTENHPATALVIDGQSLCADGYAAATHRLRYVLDHPQEGNPWFLILEGLEDCDFRRELFTWLSQALVFEWFLEEKHPKPLFFILIDSIVEDIPSPLRRYLRLCRMALPSADRRRAYFTGLFPAPTFNFDLLVQETDGLTYAQLVDVAQNLKCALYCLPDGQMLDGELQDFLNDQYPVPAAQEPLRSLAESARMFVESLPELMTHMGTAVMSAPIPQPIAQPASQPIAQPNTTDPMDEAAQKLAFQKQTEEMPVPDLVLDLFGTERLNAIRQPT